MKGTKILSMLGAAAFATVGLLALAVTNGFATAVVSKPLLSWQAPLMGISAVFLMSLATLMLFWMSARLFPMPKMGRGDVADLSDQLIDFWRDAYDLDLLEDLDDDFDDEDDDDIYGYGSPDDFDDDDGKTDDYRGGEVVTLRPATRPAGVPAETVASNGGQPFRDVLTGPGKT